MVRELDMVGSLIHSLVYEACWRLKNNGYEIHKIWIPSHLRVKATNGLISWQMMLWKMA
jgi:hypothetical protein